MASAFCVSCMLLMNSKSYCNQYLNLLIMAIYIFFWNDIPEDEKRDNFMVVDYIKLNLYLWSNAIIWYIVYSLLTCLCERCTSHNKSLSYHYQMYTPLKYLFTQGYFYLKWRNINTVSCFYNLNLKGFNWSNICTEPQSVCFISQPLTGKRLLLPAKSYGPVIIRMIYQL